MTNLRNSVLTVLAVLIASMAFPQFSRQQAIDLVLNTILSGETGTVNVHASYNVILDTEHIDKDDYISSLTCPYPSNWVFFVDDMPVAKWAHPCRYIFVNSSTGDYQVLNDKMYPSGLETDYELISHIPVPPSNPQDLTGTPFSNPAPPNDHLYAVLITSYDTKEQWKDICTIYNTLINVYGYKKENIFVHYKFGYSTVMEYGNDFDGGEASNDIDFSSYHNIVQETFQYLSGELTGNPDIPKLQPSDQLFVWAGGHGDGDGYGASHIFLLGGPMTDVELASWTSGIECAQMVFYITTCLSGGFIDNLSDVTNTECKHREVHAACDYNEFSTSEVWVTFDGTGTPNVNTVNFQENPFYWNAAIRGYFPDFDQPWLNYEGYTVGDFPLEDYIPNHPGNWDPDTNGDGNVTMGEAFEYSNWMDTWTPYGVYESWSGVPYHTYNPPPPFYEIGFEEDLLKLNGLAGLVTAPVTVQGNFVIGGTLTTDAFGFGEGVTFDYGSNIYMVNPQAKIVINQDSKIEVHDDVTFAGTSITNKIENYGKFFSPGNNITFTGIDGGQWKGLELHNSDAVSGGISLINANFDNCVISGDVGNFSVQYSDFENSGIHVSKGSVSIYNSDFNYSYIDISNADHSNYSVYIDGNQMEGDYIIKPAINITKYGNFTITGNHIFRYQDGIKIYYSGKSVGSHSIDNNELWYNNGTGILVYNSSADIQSNHSRYNDYGVKLYDRSKVTLTGWEDASLPSETQHIWDCDSYEVYSSRGSFPYLFEWNAINDDDNTEPLVYTTGQEGPFDVRNNYWGEEQYFDPEEDFYPWVGYIYEPIWELGNSGTGTDGAKTLYSNALTNVADSNYVVAESLFQEVIQQYPSTKYAKAALSDLYALEEYLDDNYYDLKSYYSTNQNILSNPELEKLADFLLNFCEIKLENWPTAIAWFENVIQNPESMEDSIFAIIDLGYTYLLMEQGGYKNAYSGTMTEHIPESQKEYNDKRDYLLSLLPGDQLSETMKQNITTLSGGELLQNVPNPFKGNTQIWYKLENESSVQLNVYNYTGQLVKTFNDGTKSEGTHYIDFNATGLKNGIYFYSISINGQTTDSKKMSIMK